jgi:uncharacterized membrane protein YphA (DoxX/SURF4 family)
MSETAFAVITLLILGWAVVSGVLVKANITGALVFTAAGYLVANPDWGPLPQRRRAVGARPGGGHARTSALR